MNAARRAAVGPPRCRLVQADFVLVFFNKINKLDGNRFLGAGIAEAYVGAQPHTPCVGFDILRNTSLYSATSAANLTYLAK